ASFSTLRVPDGVMAHPSASQFSSSQAMICVCRCPRPLGHRDHLARIARHSGVPLLFSSPCRRSFACPAPLGPAPRPRYARGTTIESRRGPRMRRRELLLTAIAMMAAPGGLRGQQKATPVIGYLNSTSPDAAAPFVAAFRQALGEAGWIEGQNVAIEYRWAGG